MSTFNQSYSAHSSSHRYTLTFKVDWGTHTSLQDIASENGQSLTDTCRELLALGLMSYRNKNLAEWEKPKIALLRGVEKARERQHLLEALSELKASVSEEDFEKSCRALGFEPSDVEDIPPQRGGRTKRERCHAFLRVLFADRPEGLPANRVLEIAAQEGFGQNMVREVASEMGIQFLSVNTPEGRVYFWKPPG